MNISHAIEKLLVWLSYVLLFMVLAAFTSIVLNLTVINPIAPWYDELWNLYPAPLFFGIDQNIWGGCGNAMCINLLGHQIPILSGPYHGLIKTLIYSPVVVWGDLLWVRLLNLGVYLSPLIYLLFQRQYFGRQGIWVVASAYYLFVPGLLIEAIFDQGQFVFANSFLIISALELVKYTSTHSGRSAAIALLLSGLAVYEKLTNLPVAFMLGLVAFIFLLTQKQYRYLVYITLIGLLMFMPYAFFISHLPDLFFGMTAAPKSSFINNFYAITQGAYRSLFQTSITLNGFFNQSFFASASFLALLLFALTYLLALAQASTLISAVKTVKIRLQNSLIRLTVLLIPALAIVMQSLFDGLNRPWHLYQLSTVLCIPIACLCLHTINGNQEYEGNVDKNNARSELDRMNSWVSCLRYILLPTLLLLGIINLGSLFIGTQNMVRVHPYDNELFAAAQKIKLYQAQNSSTLPTPVPIVCLDYSVCSNLVYLLGPQYRVLIDWAYSPVERICDDMGRISKEKYLLVTRVYSRKGAMMDSEQFMGGRTRFFEDHCSGPFEKISSMNSDLSMPRYQIYYHQKP